MRRAKTHNMIRHRRARGATAVMAMVYLVLFATLALGFYAAVATSTQVAGNEQRSSRALMSAESGMQFMKYQLATLGVPAGTPQENLFDAVYNRLSAKLNGYPNMAGQDVGINEAETEIYVPSSGYIALDGNGAGFRATISRLTAEKLSVTVTGRFNTTDAGRAVRMEYANFPNPARIFNYGLASKAAVNMNGNVTVRGISGNAHMGSVLVATDRTDIPALTMSGSPQISGDVSFTQGNPSMSISSNATIAGLKSSQAGFSDHVHTGIYPPPEFPTVDTSQFKQYAVNQYTAAMGNTLINCWLPPGNYNFNNATVMGVLYIYQPATVRFGGQTTMTGTIVVDNEKHGTPSTNKIELYSVDASPMSELDETYDDGLKALGGALLLADNFTAEFNGNFNTVSGSIVASKIAFSGTAGGTVKGSVINLEDTAVTLGGTSDIIVESQGTSNYPAGLRFGSHYSPLPYTYEEVRP